MYFILQGVDLLIAPTRCRCRAPGWLQHLAWSIGPVPGGVVTIGVPLLIWFGLRFVPFRRLLYAVGSNDTTAFSSGVNVNAVRVASYALGGLFAGIGGLALTGLVSSANASQATEYTLAAIAAVVLGGTSLAGGRGGLLGALFGAFSIYLLQNLLATFQIDPAYLEIVYGGMLVVAVVLGGVLSPVGAGGRRGHSAIWTPAPWQCPAADLEADSQVLAEPDATGAVVSPTAVDESQETPVAARAPSLRRGSQPLQARYPIVQLLAVAAVFIYGAITLPGLGSWNSISSILVLAALSGSPPGPDAADPDGWLRPRGLRLHRGRSADRDRPRGRLPHLLRGRDAARWSERACSGGLAGNICHRFRINPLIVTLAMGTIAVGLVGGAERRPRRRERAAVADDPRRAGDDDLWSAGPAGRRHLDRRRCSCSRSSCTERRPAGTCSPRGEPTRGRLRARQHAPGLDRHVRVQRGRLGARRGADRRLRGHG